jgi:MFS family permease
MGSVVLFIIILFAQIIKKDPAKVGQFPYDEDQKELQNLNLKVEGLSLKEAVCRGQFWVLFGTGFCYGYSVFSTMVHIVPHAIELGIPALKASNLIATIGGLGILGKVFWGKIGDIIGNRQILIIGFIFVLVSSSGLVKVETGWALFLMAGVFGFGYGGITVSHSPIIAELFGIKSHGLIFGVFDISVMVGAAIGPWLTGFIFDLTGVYRLAFLLSSVVNFSGIILGIFLKTKRGRK